MHIVRGPWFHAKSIVRAAFGVVIWGGDIPLEILFFGTHLR